MSKLTTLLLEWYKTNGRKLPWRVKGGAHFDPYIVLVSEVMLQQTTVKTVIPYFEKFIKRFPTVQDLAKASLEEVYSFWQGLGYYTRAKSLHQTAQLIVEKFGGEFPQNKKDILKLKGIGPYTAASFLALAFNVPETVVDGNVMRVICRLYHLTEPLDRIQDIIRKKAKMLTSKTKAADYASAIMDLGAMICTPKKPQCFRCPWQAYCRSREDAFVEDIPQRKKIKQPEKQAYVYICCDNKEKIFIRKKTEKGLLSGLYEFPWSENKLPDAVECGVFVQHVFTHFKLKLSLCLLPYIACPNDGIFIKKKDFARYATSTLMKKVFSKLNTLNL